MVMPLSFMGLFVLKGPFEEVDDDLLGSSVQEYDSNRTMLLASCEVEYHELQHYTFTLAFIICFTFFSRNNIQLPK